MTKFTVNTVIDNERIEDLLCCAFEGGVGYWCEINEYRNPDNVSVKYKHMELPLTENGAVVCQAFVDGDERDDDDNWLDEDGNMLPLLVLNKEAVQSGLDVMQKKYPSHFADFLSESEDAITGDVFLQCCLLGELVYG